jgi:hypothetical protein
MNRECSQDDAAILLSGAFAFVSKSLHCASVNKTSCCDDTCLLSGRHLLINTEAKYRFCQYQLRCGFDSRGRMTFRLPYILVNSPPKRSGGGHTMYWDQSHGYMRVCSCI